MRWLVVGDGLHYLKALRAIGEQELAILEPDREKNRAAWTVVGKGGAYESIEDVRKAPDVVVICTPPADHVADIQRWPGANLVVVPPLVPSLEAKDALIGAIKRDRMGMVACPLRFHTGIQGLAQLHRNGHFGDVFKVTASGGYPVTRYQGTWRGQRAQGGGLFWDHAGLLDVLRWAFGPPLVERAGKFGQIEEADIEASAHAILHFQSAVAFVELFVVVPEAEPRMGIQLVGPKADRPPFMSPPVLLDPSGDAQAADAAVWAQAYQAEVTHWRKAIAGEEEPVQDFGGGLAMVEILQGLDASAEKGLGVKFQRDAQVAT